ncbi:MAG: hypothetical protein DDT19_02484 [Syntrophomonadaceae bacterium]|nr:hypothetical protein [Bacillota bacterium]
MNRKLLEQLYIRDKKSVHEIAKSFHCSDGKINYWLEKYLIPKRSISDAIYTKHNPNGDPFSSRNTQTNNDSFLFGLGLGLYWGEGTKKNLRTIRLGNTDPHLIRAFLIFLRKIYDIDDSKLRFALQIFTDMDQKKEEKFWRDFLNIDASQFYKTINTRSGSIGTYRAKSEHGVLTLYFGNKKLRDILIGEIEKLKEFR